MWSPVPVAPVCHDDAMDDNAECLPDGYQSFRRRFGNVFAAEDR